MKTCKRCGLEKSFSEFRKNERYKDGHMRPQAPRPTGQKKAEKRTPQVGMVEGLSVARLQSEIQWRGMVRLHQLNEDSESYLADVEWPKKSGSMYYGCVSTGLLFDKQSGACRQSSNVTLDTGSVESVKFTAAQFGKWHRERVMGGTRDIVISKRGPKPKGYVAPEAEDADY